MVNLSFTNVFKLCLTKWYGIIKKLAKFSFINVIK